MDQVERERRWWDEHLDEEDELKKPYRSEYEYSRWKRTFNLITEHYNFNGKRIFDGGCGSGIFTFKVSEYYNPKEVVGLDISKKMIKLAKIRNKNRPNVKFIRGNLEDTGLPVDYFDVAVIIDALHHVPSAYKVLKEMKRIARDIILHHVPSAYKVLKEMKRIARDIILAEPNALNPIRRINELKFRKEDVKETSFTKLKLKKYLSKLEYRKIKFYNYNFIPRFCPTTLIEVFERLEEKFERVPLLKEFSGAILVIAKR